MKRSGERSIHNMAPLPAIRLGTRERRGGLANRGIWLVVFMRVVAMVWILQGLQQWADLLLDPTGNVLFDLSPQRTTAVFFFSVLDFVAAIGLWLATPWGGVVWLVTVGAQMLSILLLPGFWTHARGLCLTDLGLVAAYALLAWLAATAEQQRTEQG